MKKSMIRRGAAVALSLLVAIYSISGHGILPGITSYADVERTAVVNATTLNVRSGAGTGFSVVDKLTNGAAVTVLGETNGSDGKVWYQIRFSGSTGAEKTGYARSDFIRFPVAYSNDSDFEAYLTAQRFPESYKTGLRQLHAMYPNWVFTAQHTNLDWNTVIENESLVGRNLVYNGSISSWKSTAEGAYNWETSTWPSFDSGSYVAASSALIAYYMDPRNFLDDKYVFQFLLHSYDASAHTAEGLRSMVEGTFLSGTAAVSGEYGNSGGTQGGPLGPLGTGGGIDLQGPSGSGTGVSTQGPSGSGGSGSSTQSSGTQNGSGAAAGSQGPLSGSGNAGVSTQAPGSQSGSTGSGNAGVSTQAPGSQSGSGNAGVSTQAPGSQSVSAGSGNTGVSTQAPGSQSGSAGSGNAGVSTQAPSGSGNSNVSFGAPGSVASAGGTGSSRILGGIRPVIGNSHLLMTITPGMTSGPGSTSSGSSSGGSGPLGLVGGPLAGSASGTVSGTDGSGSAAPTADYVSIIMNAGVQSGVNPYVLAAMIIQEQGTKGTSNSISGTVSGYTGYYNFFNIEAYRSGDMEATTRGLWYASQTGSYGRPWNSIDKSITGGALYYGTNYVKVGQDTFYLKKFNVQGSNLYKHQYMTNIQGAASEGAKLSEAYSTQLKQTSKLEFKIPVYLNMPETACAKPTVDGSPNNKLSGLAVDGFAITPTFNRDTSVYDLIVDSSVTEVKVVASAYSDSAVVSGTGIISLQSGNNEIRITVKAQNGDVREYVIRVVKQQNGPSYNSAIGSGGLSGGSGPLGPGAGSVQSGGSSSGNGPSGPLSSGSGGPLGSGSTSGPGGSTAEPAGSSGPGSVSSGTSSGGYGPGGSNVTIVP